MLYRIIGRVSVLINSMAVVAAIFFLAIFLFASLVYDAPFNLLLKNLGYLIALLVVIVLISAAWGNDTKEVLLLRAVGKSGTSVGALYGAIVGTVIGIMISFLKRVIKGEKTKKKTKKGT